YRAGRAVLPDVQDRADGGAHHRLAARVLAGLVVHRAGTVCEGEEARDPVRPDGNDPVRGRRGLLALQGVPRHLEVLRDLVSRIRHVHAANRAGLFLVSNTYDT